MECLIIAGCVLFSVGFVEFWGIAIDTGLDEEVFDKECPWTIEEVLKQ